MADIRFQIEGNKPPFVANVYDGSTLVCTKHIEYSGTCGSPKYTCIIIGGLNGNQDYTLSLSDSIGTTIHKTIHTCPDIVSLPKEDKTINLNGIISSISSSVDSYGYTHEWQTLSSSESKELSIIPALKSGEELNACFDITAAYSITGIMNDNCTYVKLYKSCDGSTYTLFDQVCGNQTKTIQFIGSNSMKCGDSICYDMYSSIAYKDDEADTYCANTNISLTNISGSTVGNITCNNTSFNISLSHTISPTTTAPPEGVNYTICLDGTLNGSNYMSSPIIVTPPLQAGASFNLQIELCSNVSTSDVDAVVSAYACVNCGSSIYCSSSDGYACVNTTTTDVDLNPPAECKSMTISNINCDNINDFCAIIAYHTNSCSADKSAQTKVNLIGISKVNGADVNSYSLSSNSNENKIELLYSETTTTTTSSSSGGGGGGIHEPQEHTE